MDKSNTTAQDTAAKAIDAGKTAADEMTKGAERVADAAQDAMQKGAAKASAQTEQMTDRAAAIMSVGADYGRNMAQGFQTIAAEWAEASRMLAENTASRMAALAQARNVVDLMGAQRELITGGFQDMLTAQQRIGSLSVSVMTEAAQGATRLPTRLAA